MTVFIMKYNDCKIDKLGNKFWFINQDPDRSLISDDSIIILNEDNPWIINGPYHRVDGPAIEIFSNGKIWSTEWYLNGKRHREGGPALDYHNGHEEWYMNGLHHREDGPAITHQWGDRIWCINGKWHRQDGPAVERSNGDKEWYINGKRRSRNDGPAIEFFDGRPPYYYDEPKIRKRKKLNEN